MRCHDVIFTCFSGVDLAIVLAQGVSTLHRPRVLDRTWHGRNRGKYEMCCFCEAFHTLVFDMRDQPRYDRFLIITFP